ncbi:MAG: hypothetical protein OXH90_04635 [Paracoccaceae bacterium]|nr:hypothetical protein [Paracoccaceae bacterium]
MIQAPGVEFPFSHPSRSCSALKQAARPVWGRDFPRGKTGSIPVAIALIPNTARSRGQHCHRGRRVPEWYRIPLQ